MPVASVILARLGSITSVLTLFYPFDAPLKKIATAIEIAHEECLRHEFMGYNIVADRHTLLVLKLCLGHE